MFLSPKVEFFAKTAPVVCRPNVVSAPSVQPFKFIHELSATPGCLTQQFSASVLSVTYNHFKHHKTTPTNFVSDIKFKSNQEGHSAVPHRT